MTPLKERFDDVTTSEASLRNFLHGLPGVDQVGAEARAASLSTRSIKTTAKAFAIDLAMKDIGLAVDAGRQNGVPMMVGSAARESYTIAAKSLGLGGRDVSAMLEAQCRLSGVPTPRLKEG